MAFQEYVFKTYTRDELVAFVRDMALSLPPELITNNDIPFIIGINGTTGCGKSLFWDEIKNALLGDKAKQTKSPERADVGQPNYRHYERWKGRLKGTRQALRIVFADMMSLGEYNKEVQAIEDFMYAPRSPAPCPSQLNALASLFLASNSGDSYCDLDIEITTDVMNLEEDWERDITLCPLNPKLQQDPKLQAFLARHSAPLELS